MKEETVIHELKIDVASALPGVGDRRRLKGSARVVVADEYELVFFPGDDVVWEIEIRRIAGGVSVSGRLSGQVTLECYRCLESFTYPFSLKLREHALWLSDEEIEPGDDYSEEYMVADGAVDLLPIFRDAICLAFPSKRVCDEACRGLCPVCGANLNREPCGCDTRAVDVRLKPLEELKKRMQEKGG